MTPTGATGPRVLLRQLREVMAGDGTPEQRLDTLTRIIAANMVAEVCSIYLMRPGEVLELSATHGLKPEAVHNTRLRVGEGIVGDVAAHARPLALRDAQKHPNFAYRPETGEDMFHSMLSVPVVRSGTVIGVLAVQNRTLREIVTQDTTITAHLSAAALAQIFDAKNYLGMNDTFIARALKEQR